MTATLRFWGRVSALWRGYAPPEAFAGPIRRRFAGVVAAALLVATVAACGDDAGNATADGATDDAESQAGTEWRADGRPTPGPAEIATGGIEIDAPEGWQEIPLPALGFGVAIPDGWEAVVLSDEGLASLRRASPAVPGFVASATAAERSGAVFYAAGVEDPAGADADDARRDARNSAHDSARIVDLKVRADTASGAVDADDLEDFARQAAERLPGARVRRVADAPLPIIDIRYRAPATPVIDADDLDEHGAADGAAGEAAGEAGDASTEARTRDNITVEGTERLVLATSGIIYSFIVTSEDAADHEELAPLLLGTVSFPPGWG